MNRQEVASLEQRIAAAMQRILDQQRSSTDLGEGVELWHEWHGEWRWVLRTSAGTLIGHYSDNLEELLAILTKHFGGKESDACPPRT